MCSFTSDLMICKYRKSMVIHDTECPFWDQVSLNNPNPHPIMLIKFEQFLHSHLVCMNKRTCNKSLLNTFTCNQYCELKFKPLGFSPPHSTPTPSPPQLSLLQREPHTLNLTSWLTYIKSTNWIVNSSSQKGKHYTCVERSSGLTVQTLIHTTAWHNTSDLCSLVDCSSILVHVPDYTIVIMNTLHDIDALNESQWYL